MPSLTPLVTCLALAVTLTLAPTVSALRFTLHPGTRQCFTEDLPTSTKIHATAAVGDGIGKMEIDVWITTMQGTVLYHHRAPSHGKLTFTTPAAVKRSYSGIDNDEPDDEDYAWTDETYRICLEHQNPQGAVLPAGAYRKVGFSIEDPALRKAIENGERRVSHGHASDDDVENVSQKLRTMHSTMSLLISELSTLQQRERKMVKRSKKDSGRIVWLCLLAIIFCAVTAATQYAYYKSYFRQKKMC